MVEIGHPPPPFTLLSDEDRKVSLTDYRGKMVVLYFYPKDGTPVCTREAQEFRDLADEFREENAVALGVSKASVTSHKKFKEKHNLPFLLRRDPEGKVLEMYGV